MRVIAAPGLRVPLEGKPRQYIEHDPAKPVDLPDTSYYRRRLLEGDLVEVADEPVTAPASAKTDATAKKGARA